MLTTEQFKAKLMPLLNERGMTLYEVSRKAGHAKNWLWERLQGKAVTVATIRQVAKVLKVAPAFFLNGDNSKD